VYILLIDESVLAFILEWKSGKFQWNKEGNTLVTSYCLVWAQFLPHAQYGCGVLFICAMAYQGLHPDKLINSTLSLFINSALGVGV
jgi:hypothetical protein